MMKEFINQVINGDCREVLRTFPDGVIDCVVTSPPYWGLRDYGIEPTIWGGDEKCEHSWEEYSKYWDNRAGSLLAEKGTIDFGGKNDNRKHITSNFCTHCNAWRGTLGLEPHPSQFIEHLVEIFREVRRVLKDTGSVWVNLGDTYFGGGRGGNDHGGMERLSSSGYGHMKIKPDGNWLQPKQLMLLPHRVAIALQDDGWVIRNDCIWYKRNPMPFSGKDRFNVVKEYLFFMVKKSKGYWFDLDAVREEHMGTGHWDYSKTHENINHIKDKNGGQYLFDKYYVNPAGKNPGDIFHLSTESFADAHFATFPTKLIEKPILATCPEWICVDCGEARVRIVDVKYIPAGGKGIEKYADNTPKDNTNPGPQGMKHGRANKHVTTTGWTTCKCPEPRTYKPGIVLDIFGGAGTTGIVAKRSNRNYVLIEAKPEYCEMARIRIARDGREEQHDMEQNGQENLFK